MKGIMVFVYIMRLFLYIICPYHHKRQVLRDIGSTKARHPMNRFITYWKTYGCDFGEKLLGLIYTHAKVYSYQKGSVVCGPALPSRHCYFVLSGALEAQKLMKDQSLRIVDFILPHQSFTGTVHLHTPKSSDRSYTCIKPSEILQIDNTALKVLAHENRTISEILHILKQRMINRQQLHIDLLQQSGKYQQFVFLQKEMADLCQQLPSHLLADFLGIARSTYFNYKKRWIRDL